LTYCVRTKRVAVSVNWGIVDHENSATITRT
jgi:hypothetical protein